MRCQMILAAALVLPISIATSIELSQTYSALSSTLVAGGAFLVGKPNPSDCRSKARSSSSASSSDILQQGGPFVCSGAAQNVYGILADVMCDFQDENLKLAHGSPRILTSFQLISERLTHRR